MFFKSLDLREKKKRCIAVIFKQPKGFTLITETRVFIEGVTMF